MGVMPNLFLRPIEPSVERMLDALPHSQRQHDQRAAPAAAPAARASQSMARSLNAIVPMACVTAAGIAAMVAEAFRDPGERMPIAGLGVVGLVGAGIRDGPALEPQRVELRRRRGRQLRPVRHRSC